MLGDSQSNGGNVSMIRVVPRRRSMSVASFGEAKIGKTTARVEECRCPGGWPWCRWYSQRSWAVIEAWVEAAVVVSFGVRTLF